MSKIVKIFHRPTYLPLEAPAWSLRIKFTSIQFQNSGVSLPNPIYNAQSYNNSLLDTALSAPHSYTTI